jgi:hypothetical protein
VGAKKRAGVRPENRRTKIRVANFMVRLFNKGLIFQVNSEGDVRENWKY